MVVSENGRVVYEGALGLADRERGVPFTLATPVDGGSLAKTFTAAAVLALVAEGRLGLDDPARRHVPELPYDVTVRQLVTHSSGLPDYGRFEPFFGPEEISGLVWRTLEGGTRGTRVSGSRAPSR